MTSASAADGPSAENATRPGMVNPADSVEGGKTGSTVRYGKRALPHPSDGGPMSLPRASGILLHPTSLPGPHGIGDLGAEAYRFAHFLELAGHTLWQVLPLNPTGYGDSPF